MTDQKSDQPGGDRLLLCPFCNGEPWSDVNFIGKWQTTCKECHCGTPAAFETRSLSEIAWNTRPPTRDGAEGAEPECAPMRFQNEVDAEGFTVSATLVSVPPSDGAVTLTRRSEADAYFKILQTISRFPITDPKNQDAQNMRMIAEGAIALAEPEVSEDQLVANAPEPLKLLGFRLADMLDADGWNNIEPLLLDIARLGAAETRQQKNEREMAEGTRCNGACNDGMPCHCVTATPPVREDREILEQCAKLARQFELDMSGSQLDDRDIENIQHGANVASNAIADAILSLPVQPGAGEREAWQWLGGMLPESAPDWVAEASEPTASGLAAPTLTGGLTAGTARGKQRAKIRDWIARIDGEIYLFTESAWASLSRQAPPSSSEGGR